MTVIVICPRCKRRSEFRCSDSLTYKLKDSVWDVYICPHCQYPVAKAVN